jgi:hypothetical protein
VALFSEGSPRAAAAPLFQFPWQQQRFLLDGKRPDIPPQHSSTEASDSEISDDCNSAVIVAADDLDRAQRGHHRGPDSAEHDNLSEAEHNQTHSYHRSPDSVDREEQGSSVPSSPSSSRRSAVQRPPSQAASSYSSTSVSTTASIPFLLNSSPGIGGEDSRSRLPLRVAKKVRAVRPYRFCGLNIYIYISVFL